MGDLELLVSQKKDMHYPRFLARLGQTIRASIHSGKALPNSAILIERPRAFPSYPVMPNDRPRGIPIYVDRPRDYEHPRGNMPCSSLVSVSGTTQGRIHNILISLEEDITSAEAANRCSQARTEPVAVSRDRELREWDPDRELLVRERELLRERRDMDREPRERDPVREVLRERDLLWEEMDMERELFRERDPDRDRRERH